MLCVHGGLSPDVRTLDQIRTIQRCQEIPHEGPFCGMFFIGSESASFQSPSTDCVILIPFLDLMWSDPEEIDNWLVSPRGAGWLFGRKVTLEVLYF